MNLNRKDFLLGGAALLGTSSIAMPTRGIVGARQSMELSDEEQEDILPASNYVQDGLVAMWDAVENVGVGRHNRHATTWVDLVGGVQLAVQNPYPEHVNLSWANRAFCYEDDYAGYNNPVFSVLNLTLTSSLVDIYNNGVGTFEMCCSRPIGAVGNRFYSPLGYADGSTILNSDFCSENLLFSRNLLNVIGTYGFRGNGTFINGAMSKNYTIKKRTHTAQDGSVVSYFLRRGNSDSSLKRFFCIRWYNRSLTTAELAYNYSIDRERFLI